MLSEQTQHLFIDQAMRKQLSPEQYQTLGIVLVAVVQDSQRLIQSTLYTKNFQLLEDHLETDTWEAKCVQASAEAWQRDLG